MATSRYPKVLHRDASTIVQLDPTRLLLSFVEPVTVSDLVPLLADFDLEPEPDVDLRNAGGQLETVNHTDRRVWVRTALREPVGEGAYAALAAAFGERLEWIGPVYHHPDAPGRAGLHCPLPNAVMVLEDDDDVPLREDVDRSANLLGYRYYVIDQPQRVSAYQVRSQLAAERHHPWPDSVLFDNMPLLVPLSGEPADTFYQGLQWNMTRIGMYGPGLTAWEYARNGNQITIAVLDSGCDLTHPDFYFVPGTGGPSGNGANNPNAPGFAAGHGTWVAGLAAAVAHNLKGIAGVAGYTCVIMPLAFTNFTEVEAATAITFAVRNGARVINMSFNSNIWNPVLVDRAIEDAHRNNVVICVSAGNMGGSLTYPATHPNVIACGSTDRNDVRASDSNFGTRLSVMAPGVGVITTTVRATGDIGEAGGATRDYQTNFSGTSAATPHVAGLAALMIGLDPTLTADDVRDIIEGTADKVGGVAYTQAFPNGPWNRLMGYGRINALDAILAALPARP